MSLGRMCPERGRPQPRNNCIHLNLCMQPASQVRVTMMKNNNLQLDKLLCKDRHFSLFLCSSETNVGCLQPCCYRKGKVLLMNSNVQAAHEIGCHFLSLPGKMYLFIYLFVCFNFPKNTKLHSCASMGKLLSY